MAKQPYIQFYLGDYIKDTRVLPLNVKGGWVDLILAMWDNDPRGEINGTMDDYSRIMNCSKEEAILVIQTLKQKKIFDYQELPDGHLRIVSRKQKKMLTLSEIRQKVGEKGGNPILLNQKVIQSNNQKDKLNTEYEYINGSEVKNVFKGVQGEINGLPKNGFFVDSLEKKTELTETQIGATIQFISIKCKKALTESEVAEHWEAFKINQFDQHEWYNSFEKLLNHFRNSIKLEIQKELNGSTTHQRSAKSSGDGKGISDKRTDTARNW